MKHLFLTTALCAAIPLAAQADEIMVRADLDEAVVYSSGADVTRRGTTVIPAGQHRLLIVMPDLDRSNLPRITGPEGVRFGPPQPLYNQPLEEGDLDDPAQAAARTTLEAAEDALLAAQDRLAEADADIRSIETQQGYIAAILRGGEDGVAMPGDPAVVPQFLATLGAESGRLAAELQAARIARRDLADAVTEAQTILGNASRALQQLRPFGPQVNVYAVDVTASGDVEGEIALSYLTDDAGWRPTYELNLETETNIVTVDRFVTLATHGSARWQDVAVTFSTASPDRAREPSGLVSRPARIVEPGILSGTPVGRSGTLNDAVALEATPSQVPAIAGFAGAVAPVVIVEDTAVSAEFDGLSISYPYPTAVTVGATNEVLLPFDTLELQAETENRAVPRWDDTAFLVAITENDTAEPILPGDAVFYRDGALMGAGYLPLIAAGAEAEMAFGALDNLQLIWIDRSLAEGDRGLFTTSTTQMRELAFGVENTGSESANVRILYATPFAEQEDLDLDLTLSRGPDEEDVDDLRGVHAWDVEVGPGDRELVEMTVEFEFPEGQILDWRPCSQLTDRHGTGPGPRFRRRAGAGARSGHDPVLWSGRMGAGLNVACLQGPQDRTGHICGACRCIGRASVIAAAPVPEPLRSATPPGVAGRRAAASIPGRRWHPDRFRQATPIR